MARFLMLHAGAGEELLFSLRLESSSLSENSRELSIVTWVVAQAITVSLMYTEFDDKLQKSILITIGTSTGWEKKDWSINFKKLHQK